MANDNKQGKVFVPIKLKVLQAFESDIEYTVKELSTKLPSFTYPALEYNISAYYQQKLLSREKVDGSRAYRYKINKRGMERREFLERQNSSQGLST